MSATKRTKEIVNMETYTDLEQEFMFQRGKYQEDKRSKITRVNRVYNLFNELSYAEKDQFINLIKKEII